MALKTTQVEAKGGQSRHRSLGLSDEEARRIYEVMRLARAVDERMWLINRQGRAPFVISCQGQEGAQVGTAAALRPGYDWVAPYYRDAGVHKLGVIFICENNGYAISVPQSRQMAIANLADRAAGYGFPGVVVDGNDVLACYEVARQAVERARRGEGPTLIEAKTYRFTPHSSDDDDKRYRQAEEVAIWRQKDPIQRYATYLRESGILTDPVEREITERVDQQVDEATEYAEQAPDPTPADLMTFVYKQGTVS